MVERIRAAGMTSTATEKSGTIVADLVAALFQIARESRTNLLQAWIYVPLGIFAILAVCFGVDRLFHLGSLPFPASVAVLIALFLVLLLSERVLGEHRTRKAVALIEIPALWSLRWINVFFTPSFVLLPLSPPIGIVEVFKIIAVFVIGFVLMMLMTAWGTRGLHLLVGSSKRAMTERAEELGNEADDIPMAMTPRTEDVPTPATTSAAVSIINVTRPEDARLHGQAASPQHVLAVRLQEASSNDSSQGTPPTISQPVSRAPSPTPTSHVLAQTQRSQFWAGVVIGHLDLFVYVILFLFVGLPVYYASGYAMPAQTTLAILIYFAAAAVPPKWKQILHPVLVSSLFTVLGIWALGAVKGSPLRGVLAQYRTGTKYLQVWSKSGQSLPLPGAGDIFGSVLDVSIVALALPMYRYRRELKEHSFAIIIPNTIMSIACLFVYPPICYAIGITSERSLAFPARSLTLALAIPATANLGGDGFTIAAIAIMSGISGVLFGQKLLAWMKIPEDDYVTRGVTLGANSSALATAMLLPIDPRAAALSSLSMGLFGTITVLFTSIGPISSAIRSLAGL